MPPELLGTLAAYLTIDELEALASLPNKALARSVTPHLHAALLLRLAPTVTSFAMLDRALHGQRSGQARAASVTALPPQMQTEPLIALASRIEALPEADRAQASASLAAFPYEGPQNPLLDELRSAAARGAYGLERREQQLVGAWGRASNAVIAGENVLDIARRQGISGSLSLEQLDNDAARHIGQRLTDDDHLPTLIQNAGITSESAVQALELQALRRVGLGAIRRGESPEEVTRRLGLSHPPATQELTIEAARRDVARGAHVVETVDRYGTPELRDQLETLSALTAGARAAMAGEAAPQIGQRLGLRSPVARQHLQRLEAAARRGEAPRHREVLLASRGGEAFQAVQEGANVHEVCQRLQITDMDVVNQLEYQAALRVLDTYGEQDHLPTVLRQAGVTTSRWLLHVEQEAVLRTGVMGIERGEEPEAVAARMGITDPRAMHALNVEAACGDVARGASVDQAMAARRLSANMDRLELEVAALGLPALRALDAGEAPDEIANRLGIRLRNSVAALQQMAAPPVPPGGRG